MYLLWSVKSFEKWSSSILRFHWNAKYKFSMHYATKYFVNTLLRNTALRYRDSNFLSLRIFYIITFSSLLSPWPPATTCGCSDSSVSERVLKWKKWIENYTSCDLTVSQLCIVVGITWGLVSWLVIGATGPHDSVPCRDFRVAGLALR